jgi:hypothetical protein
MVLMLEIGGIVGEAVEGVVSVVALQNYYSFLLIRLIQHRIRHRLRYQLHETSVLLQRN